MGSSDAVDRFLGDRGYQSIGLSRTPVGHLQTLAKINGQDARLLIDTGASATVIDKSAAERLALTTASVSGSAGGCPESDVSGSPVEATTLSALSLDAFHLQEVEARVLDLSSVNGQLAEAGADRIDGILGADLLEGHGAIIEYAQRILYLREPALA